MLYIEEWFTRTKDEANALWGNPQMPLTYRGVKAFQTKFGVGCLVDLFGGRSYSHLVNFPRLTESIWQQLRMCSIPGMHEKFTLPVYDEDSGSAANIPYTGDCQAVRDALQRHLDDAHDLSQNLPYNLDAILKAYPNAFDADVLSDNAIIAGIRHLLEDR